jgi:hypothetical protein
VVAEHSSSAILLKGAAEDQYLHQLLEDHPVGDSWPMAAKRMVYLSLRKQGAELLPDEFDDVWWWRGHEKRYVY